MSKIQLSIITPEKIAFQGQATRVVLPGKEGSFEVLKNHAPLVSILRAGEIEYVDQNVRHAVAIPGGVVEVKENQVTVLTMK